MGNNKQEIQEIGEVLLKGNRCRCGHEWMSRDNERPRVCPHCKSANWDKPYRFRRKPKNHSTQKDTVHRK